MDYNRETENKRLLYSKLSDKIYQYIKDENLRPGDKLPGERKLAAEWKVSRPSLQMCIRDRFPFSARLMVRTAQNGTMFIYYKVVTGFLLICEFHEFI